MKEFEGLFKLWNAMSGGSVQCILSQDQEMLAVSVTPDKVTIDIKHPSAVDFVAPFVSKNMARKKSTKQYIESKRSLVLGLLGSMKAKTDELSRNLAMAQNVANMLADHQKDLILLENGKQLVKLGHSANSLSMRLLSLEHIEVSDLGGLRRLMDRMKSG